MKIWQALEYIKTNGPVERALGICAALRDIPMSSRPVAYYCDLHSCFQAWPEFTGLNFYPVPGHDGNSPDDSFDHTDESDMWNPEHPYGAARLRLLDHCINWFKEKDL